MTRITMKIKAAAATMLMLSLCACKLGPNYKRPIVATPDQYRGAAPELSKQAAGTPFAAMKWQAVFGDKVLQDLIQEALSNNYDIRIAATRILEAQAAVGITRAGQLPSLGGTVGVQNERSAQFPGAPTFDLAGLQFKYLVDFWGQYRRATEAARANLLATRYAKDLVQTTLISDVADAYFQLRQLDSQLDFSNQTVANNNESLRINIINFKGGRIRDHGRISSAIAGATGGGRSHHASASDRADGKSTQYFARQKSGTDSARSAPYR